MILSFQSLIRGKSLNKTGPYTDFNEVAPAQEQQELPRVQALHVEEKQEHSIWVCHYYCRERMCYHQWRVKSAYLFKPDWQESLQS